MSSGLERLNEAAQKKRAIFDCIKRCFCNAAAQAASDGNTAEFKKIQDIAMRDKERRSYEGMIGYVVDHNLFAKWGMDELDMALNDEHGYSEYRFLLKKRSKK